MFILEYLKYIFTTELSKLTGFQFVLMFVLSLVVIAAMIGVAILIAKFFALIFRGIRNIISAKSKCQHIQCGVCGRTLDRCVCAKNKGRSNASRLHHHTLEEKAKKKARKSGK